MSDFLSASVDLVPGMTTSFVEVRDACFADDYVFFYFCCTFFQ